MKLDTATTTAHTARGTKVSPFVLLSETALDQLLEVSEKEPSVADMIAGYRSTLETATMYSEILRDECVYYEVPLAQ